MMLNWNLQRGEGRFKPSGSKVLKGEYDLTIYIL